MKWIKRLLFSIFMTLFLMISVYFIASYTYYKEITNHKSMDKIVQEIQNKETYVDTSQISDSLLKATVSIEDRRFYKHSGVDFIGIGRAIISQFSPRIAKSGGSTITQQTAKNMYEMFEFHPLNKGCQMFMAWELESKYSKDEILALYVNIINYGDKHFGIYEASTNYFASLPMDLTFAQSSLLAGIPQSPSYFQLSTGFEQAKQRQWSVLNAMEKEGYISREEIEMIWNQAVFVQ